MPGIRSPWRDFEPIADPFDEASLAPPSGPLDPSPYTGRMPESYGKRQRQGVKARKAAAKEERRIERNRRKDIREGGGVDELDGPEEASPEEASPEEGPAEQDATEDEASGA